MRAVVLHIPVNVVRNLIIHGHVIHLPDGQLHAMESLSVHRRDIDSAIVGDHKAVWIHRVNPNIVVVAAPRNWVKCLAAIHGMQERAIRNQNFIFICRSKPPVECNNPRAQSTRGPNSPLANLRRHRPISTVIPGPAFESARTRDWSPLAQPPHQFSLQAACGIPCPSIFVHFVPPSCET